MKVIHKYESNTMALELSVSDDRMKLFARVTPRPDHESAKEEELLKEIQSIAPADFISRMVVWDIVSALHEGKGCDSRRVARGINPVPGKDGKLVWLVRRFSPGKVEDAEREFVDFFTLGLFENVAKGREVARIYKPSNGIGGTDVLGKPIPARGGRTLSIRFDKTIEPRPDDQQEAYTTLLAAVDGYVHDEGGKFGIRDVLHVSGNLDYSIGHIDFIGSVRIVGDVQKGFNVKAKGGIEVFGSVLGENVLSSESSVTIKGFHYGGEGSFVSAKGDYSVDAAEKIATEVGGNIYIGREARECSLHSSSAILAARAQVIGGSVWCVKGFEVKSIGNEVGIRTEVEIRNELEVTKEYRKLSENIQKHLAAASALELHIGPYLKNRNRVPLLRNQFREKMTALLDKYDQVQKSLERLQGIEKKMREGKPLESNARINVLEKVFAGAVFKTGEAFVEHKDPVQGPVSFKPSDDRKEWITVPFVDLSKG
jgi:uncharacterized protein (DUF342 family)